MGKKPQNFKQKLFCFLPNFFAKKYNSVLEKSRTNMSFWISGQIGNKFGLYQGSQTRAPRHHKNCKIWLKLQFQLLFIHLLPSIEAHGGLFLSLYGPRAHFLSKCGPRMNLSLRPLVYMVYIKYHNLTYKRKYDFQHFTF